MASITVSSDPEDGEIVQRRNKRPPEPNSGTLESAGLRNGAPPTEFTWEEETEVDDILYAAQFAMIDRAQLSSLLDQREADAGRQKVTSAMRRTWECGAEGGDDEDVSSDSDAEDEGTEETARAPNDDCEILLEGHPAAEPSGSSVLDSEFPWTEEISRPDDSGLSKFLSRSAEMKLVGVISDVIDKSIVVVKAKKSSRALDMNSVICLADRRILGVVADTFGPLKEPMYVIYPRKDDGEELLSQLEKDTEVFVDCESSTFILGPSKHETNHHSSRATLEESAKEVDEAAEDDDEIEMLDDHTSLLLMTGALNPSSLGKTQTGKANKSSSEGTPVAQQVPAHTAAVHRPSNGNDPRSPPPSRRRQRGDAPKVRTPREIPAVGRQFQAHHARDDGNRRRHEEGSCNGTDGPRRGRPTSDEDVGPPWREQGEFSIVPRETAPLDPYAIEKHGTWRRSTSEGGSGPAEPYSCLPRSLHPPGQPMVFLPMQTGNSSFIKTSDGQMLPVVQMVMAPAGLLSQGVAPAGLVTQSISFQQQEQEQETPEIRFSSAQSDTSHGPRAGHSPCRRQF